MPKNWGFLSMRDLNAGNLEDSASSGHFPVLDQNSLILKVFKKQISYRKINLHFLDSGWGGEHHRNEPEGPLDSILGSPSTHRQGVNRRTRHAQPRHAQPWFF